MPGRASLLVAVRPAGIPQQEQKAPCDLLDAGQEARIDLLVSNQKVSLLVCVQRPCVVVAHDSSIPGALEAERAARSPPLSDQENWRAELDDACAFSAGPRANLESGVASVHIHFRRYSSRPAGP